MKINTPETALIVVLMVSIVIYGLVINAPTPQILFITGVQVGENASVTPVSPIGTLGNNVFYVNISAPVYDSTPQDATRGNGIGVMGAPIEV